MVIVHRLILLNTIQEITLVQTVTIQVIIIIHHLLMEIDNNPQTKLIQMEIIIMEIPHTTKITTQQVGDPNNYFYLFSKSIFRANKKKKLII